MKKRGLSDVVTTVLIILLALAAVIIIWSFVRPAIVKAGGGISADCIQLELEPTACTTILASPFTTSTTYKWNSGDVDLDDVRVVLYHADGTSDVFSDDDTGTLIGGVLSSANANGLIPTAAVTQVAVAGVVNIGENTQTCSESAKINCIFS